MYTEQQQELLAHAQNRIQALFEEYPAPGHGPNHARRVAERAKKIALSEGTHPFLSELSGWLHDVGRAPELNQQNPEAKTHHELSYDMLRVWFQKDEKFEKHLSTEEKLELLYGIRHHWNDAAKKNLSAVILRDADKLDALGEIGLGRTIEFCGGEWSKLNTCLRYSYQFLYWFGTNTGKQMLEDEKLIEPITAFYTKELEKRVMPIEL